MTWGGAGNHNAFGGGYNPDHSDAAGIFGNYDNFDNFNNFGNFDIFGNFHAFGNFDNSD